VGPRSILFTLAERGTYVIILYKSAQFVQPKFIWYTRVQFVHFWVCVSASPFSNVILLFTLCALYPTKADVAERLEQADANFPRIFRHCTWVLKGTHTPVVLYRGERYKDYYSFKTKKPSSNTQVCIICVAIYSLK